MAFDTSQALLQGKTLFLGLTRRQKIVIAACLISAVGGLWFFVSLLGRGDYQPLYSGLRPEEANILAKRLAQEGIPSRISSDGKSLSVPGDRLDKARLDMAAQGLPQTGRLGFEIFDQTNWGESDFDEKVNYQRALEGELERTIQDLNDVAAVRVHLVLPHESLFSDREREEKASVLVKVRNGPLSEKSLRAITYLVASAVDTLRPENVTVVDADGNVPIVLRGGVKPGSPEGASAYEQALDKKLAATLTPILGIDHYVARATVEYDTSSKENTQEVYDPKNSVVLTSQVTSDQSADGGESGIPGAASNVPQDVISNTSSAATSSSGGDPASAGSYDSSGSDQETDGETSASKTYAVGRSVTHTVQPPGGIRRISAAILVDDTTQTKMVKGHATRVRQARTPEQLKQIQALAAAVLGLDAARGDFVTVENIPFHITPLHPSPPTTGVKKVQRFLNQNGDLVRYIILGLLGVLLFLFVFRPLVKQLGATIREMPRALPGPREPAPALSGAGGEFSGTGLAFEAAESQPGEQQVEDNPERPEINALKESLTERITKAPVESTHLIRGWLKESERK
ncbi:MAG: flagellar basal-body MS-ring/collar protein FliF [Acidobacteriota bacterium]